ncbi:hypothetical protein CBL_02925 [Carabus blaptoides fortunei]
MNRTYRSNPAINIPRKRRRIRPITPCPLRQYQPFVTPDLTTSSLAITPDVAAPGDQTVPIPEFRVRQTPPRLLNAVQIAREMEGQHPDFVTLATQARKPAAHRDSLSWTQRPSHYPEPRNQAITDATDVNNSTGLCSRPATRTADPLADRLQQLFGSSTPPAPKRLAPTTAPQPPKKPVTLVPCLCGSPYSR